MAEYLATMLPSWLAYLVTGAFHALLLVVLTLASGIIFVWAERKVSGRIQDRLGPTRVGGKFGWLQTIADGIKLIQKEDLVPAGADQLLFRLAPYVGWSASLCSFIALPFSDGWVPQHLNVAVFFILAVLGLEVFGVILAGYASGSKWSLFGGMREAAQVVSYEVPVGMCVVVPVLICGTMDLVAIGNMQAGLFHHWLIFHDPFTFCTFWVYFTCATASVNRAPFDLAEAESELVAGFHTEYSGFRWLFFFVAEYGSMFAVSGLASILFFGGWNGPLPITSWLGLTAENHPVLGFLGNFLGLLNFMGKCVTGVVVMMWVRWTLPRLRIDQVMKTCLKYCTPMAAIFFLGACLWTLQFPGGGGLGPWGRPYGVVAEERSLAEPPAASPASEPDAAAGSRRNVAWSSAHQVAVQARVSGRQVESHGGQLPRVAGRPLASDVATP